MKIISAQGAFGDGETRVSVLPAQAGGSLIRNANGVVVGSINGGNLPGVTVGNPGQGAALVRIFNLAYDQVRFSSTNGGFEYANVTASPVPLPLPIAVDWLPSALL